MWRLTEINYFIAVFHGSIPSAPFTSTSFLYDNTEVNSPIAADYKTPWDLTTVWTNNLESH